MGRRAGRSADDTRRLVLDAAADVIRVRGISATLDDIARHAGLSKGGVIYHYAGKDALLHALVDDLLAAFRAAVENHIDPDDHEPGRLTRAYVRTALTPDIDDPQGTREVFALITQLVADPQVAEIAAADARRWDTDLQADGLPDDTLELVLAAADGGCISSFWGAPADPDRTARLQNQLLALTRIERTRGHHDDGPCRTAQ